MANFSSFQYKKSPLAVLEACDEIGIIKNPLKTDTDAEMLAKLVCVTAMSAVDVAFTEEGDGSARIAINAKSGIDPSNSALDTDDICLFVRNSTLTRFEVIQDINDRNITNYSGDLLDIPQVISFIREPSAI